MYDAAWGVVFTRSRFPRGKSRVVFTRCCFRAGGRVTSGMISSSSASAARTAMGHRRHRRGARGGAWEFHKNLRYIEPQINRLFTKTVTFAIISQQQKSLSRLGEAVGLKTQVLAIQ